METFIEGSEGLLNAATAHGPSSEPPLHMRVAFPLKALPAVLRRFVTDAAEALGVAPECVATPAIASCAAAIGNTCRIRVNNNWHEPAIIWAVTLMESGSLKTPAYNAAVEPLRTAQRMANVQFHQAQSDYKKAKAEYEAMNSSWTTHVPPGGGGEYAGERNEIVEPVEPTPVDYYTADSTVEALAMLFDKNPRGIALTKDELSGFFTSFGAYKGGRGGDEAHYLEAYNAGPIKLNRASGKRICVEQAALSIFGTCQPAVFRKLIGADGGNQNQIENGLASRFLITAPEARRKRWRESKRFNQADYSKMIASLLMIPLQRDSDGNTTPTIIRMLPEAEKRFGEFYEEHGRETAAITNAPLRYHYAKLEAVAARLALIFYLCDCVTNELTGTQSVQEQHVLSGIALARWFGREASRVYDGYESQARREQQNLLDEIRGRGGVITLSHMRDLHRRWRNVDVAESELRALEKAGHGEFVTELPGPQGGRPTVRFRLFDEGTARTSAEIPENPQLSGPERW